MLILEKDKFLTKGTNRHLYVSDEIPGKCVKIVLLDTQKFEKNNSRWYKKILPLKFFGENRREEKYYKILNKKNAEIFNYIPKLYGWIDTNLGKGLLFEYIDNAISLKDYIEKFGIDDFIVTEFKNFFKIILKNNVQVRDQNIYNYLVQNIDSDTNEIVRGGGYKLKLIDGLGIHHLIPIYNYNKNWGRKGIIKRLNIFLDNLLSDFSDYKKRINELKEYLNCLKY
ncbi:MAG: PhoP regulatory network YrbL family protein [Elusimicrobiota bacterium]|jgi:hypothetical protein|nr:PhoP regulatory network YrbL family protein [Elusimicrobiota bacterium]